MAKLMSRKCTGERPCRSCEKAGQECRYEEVQRRKPKAVLLEERLGKSTPFHTLYEADEKLSWKD
jgi:hypothetical protein